MKPWASLRVQLPFFQGLLLGIPLLLLTMTFYLRWTSDQEERTRDRLEAGLQVYEDLYARLGQGLNGTLKALRDDPSLIENPVTYSRLHSLWLLDNQSNLKALYSPPESPVPIMNEPVLYTKKGILVWRSIPVIQDNQSLTLLGSTLLPLDTFYSWKNILRLDFILVNPESDQILFATLADPYGQPLFNGAKESMVLSDKKSILSKTLGDHLGLKVFDSQVPSEDQQVLQILVLFTLGWIFAGTTALILLSRTLMRPLQNLRKGIETMLEGFNRGDEQFQKIPVENQNEIGLAAKALNQVGGDLFSVLAKMKRLNKELLDSNTLKQHILANTSHELRTPLGVILNSSQLLQSGPLTGDQTTQVHLIDEAAQQLLKTITLILDFTTLEKQGLDESVKPWCPVSDLKQLWQKHLALADRKNLSFFLKIQSLGTITLGPQHFQRILTPLLDNAFKFTSGGSVTIQAQQRESTLSVTIADTGIGMTEEVKTKLFTPFSQGQPGLDRPYGGLGLGLTLSRELTERHGGRIELDSRPGEGTRVTVHLTGVGEPYTEAVDLAFTPQKIQTSGSEPQWNILVVDDEASNRYLLGQQLNHGSYRVTLAEDGPTALALLEKGPLPGLVLMDIMMPGMDGLEACRKIRTRWSAQELPVVFYSARSQERDIREGLDAGANDYLVKPLRRDELLSRIRPYF